MSATELRLVLEALTKQKEQLEAEADAIFSELTSRGPNGEPPAGIKDSLIDVEGYPRGDVDIVNIKNKRRRLAEINTDFKDIMKQIEKHMLDLHASLPPVDANSSIAIDVLTIGHSSQTLRPIAVFDDVTIGSPVYRAGVKTGDLLLKFADIQSITYLNGSSQRTALQDIAQLVGLKTNQEIEILIERAMKDTADEETKSIATAGQSTMRLVIVPQAWEGRGLLGCHLTPL